MNKYEFTVNSEVCIEENNNLIYKKLINYFNSRLINNVMIITGPNLNKLGVATKIKENIESDKITVRLIYSDIPQDGRNDIIKEIVKLGIINNCKGYIAVGGGSVLDIAKGVKLAYKSLKNELNNGGFDYVKKNHEDDIFLICIPTTAGTGSELTKVIVIKNDLTNRKDEIISEELLPDFTLLTDEFIKTLPQKTTFTSLMDALTHSIEAMTSLERNFISDAYAEEAIKLIFDNIEDIIKKPYDKKLRIKSLISSSMAGIAFSNSMVGLVHAISHSLGAVLNIPHDLACSLVLTEVMKFNLPYADTIYDRIFNIIEDKQNYDDNCAVCLINKIENMIKFYYEEFHISNNLKDYGLNKNNINEIVNKAFFDGARLTNCRPVLKSDIYNILTAIID